VRDVLVCGAGGFIGSHLVRRLKREGQRVCGVDLRHPRFSPSPADDFVLGDLRDPQVCRRVVDRPFDEVYHLAADMGGAGYVFTGENDAAILGNSARITINLLEACAVQGVGRVLYASSACVYPEHRQQDPERPDCREDTAYPARPDSAYGWEKLFGEQLCQAHARNHGLRLRIARYHNVFGPEGAWNDGREKAPAALCRKIAEAPEGGAIEIWGDGRQTRSFLYIDEALEGTLRLMRSDCDEPLNIGSDEMVAVDELADMIAEIAGKTVVKRHVPGPTGVRGRCSDNTRIADRLGWRPRAPLREGLRRTYRWIATQVEALRSSSADGNRSVSAAGASIAQLAAQDHQREEHVDALPVGRQGEDDALQLPVGGHALDQ